MKTKLKWNHWAVALVIELVCLLIILGYGWSAFSIITQQPGLNGNIYMYYNMTRMQYAIYSGIIAVAGLYISCYVILYLAKKQTTNLTRIFWHFLFLVSLIITCEIYLQTRFVGKA